MNNFTEQQIQLTQEIKKRINEHPQKRITFYEFMNMALYYPELGYYTKDKTKIGKNADFYTSSSVGPVFGQTISKCFVELLPYTNDNHFSILEIGGGDGRFARDVLDELKKTNYIYYTNLKYLMLEASPYHRQIQSDNLKNHLNKIIWINDLTELPQFEGIIFSNELVDSFPVYKVKQLGGELKEIYVTWNSEEEKFEEIEDDVSNHKLIDYFSEQGIILKEGQIAEVNLDALDWITAISRQLKKGYLLTIDYGYPAEELYASYRQLGSLMCYHKHLANDKLYENIGNQDITAHVNFTALMNHGLKYELETVWFTTQMHFLMNNGILDYLQQINLNNEKDPFKDQALKINRAIRQLITPGEMGETFKVLLQQKNISNKKYLFLKEVWKQHGLQ